MKLSEQLEEFLKDDINSCEELIKELLREIKELKKLLQKQNNKAYYKFLHKLKKGFKEKIEDGYNIFIKFNGKKIIVGEKLFLYDFNTQKPLKAYEVNSLYRFLYKNQKNIENSVYYDKINI